VKCEGLEMATGPGRDLAGILWDSAPAIPQFYVLRDYSRVSYSRKLTYSLQLVSPPSYAACETRKPRFSRYLFWN